MKDKDERAKEGPGRKEGGGGGGEREEEEEEEEEEEAEEGARVQVCADHLA